MEAYRYQYIIIRISIKNQVSTIKAEAITFIS
jgi:hypothetical protein